MSDTQVLSPGPPAGPPPSAPPVVSQATRSHAKSPRGASDFASDFASDTASAWNGLIIAALTLIIVLLICFMCVQLFKARRPLSGCPDREQFQGWTQYRPTCSGQWLSDRRGRCKGVTTGDMPSIEDDLTVSWAPCSGALGVPPPTFQ